MNSRRATPNNGRLVLRQLVLVMRTLPILTMLVLLVVPVASFASPGFQAQPPPGGTLNEPIPQPATPERIAGLKVPAGFQVNVFASSMAQARFMAVNTDGTVYLTQREQGNIVALNDRDGNGSAEITRTVASGLDLINGITIHNNSVYAVTDKEVYTLAIGSEGGLGQAVPIIDDLPDAGQHPSRTLGFGPDGYLYISVGSTCNNCDDSNPESATMLRAAPDGSSRVVYAKGLRNTIGWAFHPTTGEFWGMDHGSDWRGDDQPPEELNTIKQGADYGWPFCYGSKQPDMYASADPKGMTKAEYCAKTVAPVLPYQAHSAPLGFLFYTGSQFPAEYQGNAFVAMRGSWNRTEPVGYKVVMITYQNGQPSGFSDFLTGFLVDNNTGQFARPTGLVQMPDGSLLLADDGNGMIYRISYTGTAAGAPAIQPAPATSTPVVGSAQPVATPTTVADVAPVVAGPVTPVVIPGMPRTGNEQDNLLYILLGIAMLTIVSGFVVRRVQRSHRL